MSNADIQQITKLKHMRAAITGVHGSVPKHILTNADLEKMVDTNDEWILSRTGIKERRILRDNELAASDLAAEAVKKLLEKTNTNPADIDLTICGTVTGDHLFPDTANLINTKCGMVRSWGFDLNAACSGFIYSLTVGSQFIETGKYKKVVVIGVDIMSRIVDYKDRSTCIIFGDGAGAVLLEPNYEGHGLIDSDLQGDGDGLNYLYMKAGGSKHPPSMATVSAGEHYVYQDGRSVFKAAIAGMVSSSKKVMENNGLTSQDLDWIVPHQANKRIISLVAKQLDVPMEKVLINIDYYGNTTSATIPLCLFDFENKLKKGDNLLLTAFGGGFTWGSIFLKWAY